MAGRGVKSETEAYSSESDAKLAGSSNAASSSAAGAKKRPSRAGTRSVTTLSAAQLERKRANDREAQRAIRQRTKEHIEKLERRIAELTSGEDENEREQLIAALKRNKELEDENTFLRSKLDHGGMHMNMGESPGSPWTDVANLRSPLGTDNVPMLQAQLGSGNGSGSLTRQPSASYPSAAHWQQQNPFQPPSPLPRSGTTRGSGEMSPEDTLAWQQSISRSGKPIVPGSAIPQGQDTYGYMISGNPAQPSRSPNPPMPYQQMSEDPRQQMPMGQASISQQYSAIGQRGFMPQGPQQQQQGQPPHQQQQGQQQAQGSGGDSRAYPPRSQHENPQMYYQSYQRE